MNRAPIDILLQIAFVEERGGSCGEYERFLTRKHVVRLCPPSARSALINRLEGALKKTAPSNGRFSTVGMFLLTVREAQSLYPRQISSRLGLTCRVYRLLERDHISPLMISPDCWRRVRELFNLEPETLRGMIRHTHQLCCCRPSFATTVEGAGRGPGRGWRRSDPGSHGEFTIPEKEIDRIELLLQSI